MKTAGAPMFDASQVLNQCLAKVAATGTRIGGRIPYRTVDGKFDDYTDKDIAWWTNGFWAGLLWLAHQKTQDERYATWAKESEVLLDKALHDFFELHHDVGFMWHLSSVARYQVEGNRDSLRRGMIAASVLASRFNVKGKYIRAWNQACESPEKLPSIRWAIIDCLMNLPLLYWASAESGDPRFRHIAIEHTETVMRHFLRPDGSSRHIVEFDPDTGAFIKSHAGQGFGEDTAWSRGCSWLVHGLALGAQYTGRPDFLAAAEHAAHYFIDHLPADRVPPCDFKDPEARYKDASAAAITASGLLTLATLVPAARSEFYRKAAIDILAGLQQHHRAPDDDEALLTHGCVAWHFGEKDTSLIYADYFFVEALIKLQGGKGLF